VIHVGYLPCADTRRVASGLSLNCQEQGGSPFSNQVDTLAFWYKYVPTGNDSASVNLSFKKNGSFIGGSYLTLGAASSYQYMELPFYIPSTPDSIIIDLQSSEYTDTSVSYVGSDLKIDDLHFKTALTTGVKEADHQNNLVLYPNPVKTYITLEVDGQREPHGMELRMYDVFDESLKPQP